MKKEKSEKRIKLFHYKKLGRTIGEVDEFGKSLISNLEDNIFRYYTWQIFLFNVLKQISPINRTLKPDDASIEKACKKVITHFGYGMKVTVKKHTETGITEIRSKEKTATEMFCEKIISIDKLPAEVYGPILSQVNEDLKSISELITWYESLPSVRKYIDEDEGPKNHEEWISHDFYKRCIAERAIILDYQLNGIKEQALKRSSTLLARFSSVRYYYEKYYDRPYRYARTNSSRYFDKREMDLASHRLDDFYEDDIEYLQNLYSTNIKKFYHIYFRQTPIPQHFQNFDYYLKLLPFKNDRTLIFKELIWLFKGKRWISFYALALPQVEGIFSEMCSIVSKKETNKGLPYKVKSVRPFYELSSFYFDYYQYHIPKLRNRFAHTGYEDDFKFKSYDLLVDLSHLLKVFFNLDNSYVKVQMLHKRKTQEDFISIFQFSDYFKLLDDLKENEKNDIKSQIDEFEKVFLSQYCDIDFTCYELIKTLPDMYDLFTNGINRALMTNGIIARFENLNLPDIKKLLDDNKNREVLMYELEFNNIEYDALKSYFYFLNKYSKYLPSLLPETQKDLKTFKAQYYLKLDLLINFLIK